MRLRPPDAALPTQPVPEEPRTRMAIGSLVLGVVALTNSRATRVRSAAEG